MMPNKNIILPIIIPRFKKASCTFPEKNQTFLYVSNLRWFPTISNRNFRHFNLINICSAGQDNSLPVWPIQLAHPWNLSPTPKPLQSSLFNPKKSISAVQGTRFTDGLLQWIKVEFSQSNSFGCPERMSKPPISSLPTPIKSPCCYPE